MSEREHTLKYKDRPWHFLSVVRTKYSWSVSVKASVIFIQIRTYSIGLDCDGSYRGFRESPYGSWKRRTTESQAMSTTDGQQTVVCRSTLTAMGGDCTVALRDHFRSGPWLHDLGTVAVQLVCVCGVACTGRLIHTDCCMLNGLNKSTWRIAQHESWQNCSVS
jgi:hypothetical protein